MKIFKYYPPEAFDYIFKDRNISLRFSQTELLNDPFEQNIAKEMDLKAIQSIEKKLEEKLDKKLSDQEKESIINEIISNVRTDKNNDFGVLSLTNNNKNRAMWAHYSKNHSGFMIEIDLNGLSPYILGTQFKEEKNSFNLIGFVKYRKKRPAIQLGSNKKINKKSLVNKLYFTKDDIWKYESEYRMIYPFNNLDILGVDVNGLTIFGSLLSEEHLCSVVLGIKASEILEKRVTHWLNTNTKNTTLHRAFPCDKTFDFYYEEIEIRHTNDTPST